MTTFYEVRRRDGTLAAIHKRRDLPGGGKAVSWLKPDGSAGLNGTPVDALPLYGAHRLAEWPEPAPLVLVEGEKAAEALWRAGVPALATVTGAASAPSAEVLADLSGRSVLLWPDNDDAGRAHMATIAALLADVAAVAIVEWPDAPAKGDAADFLADGRTAADVRELLARARDADAEPCRTLADIDTTPPGPLLLDMLEPDVANLLYGAGGIGKTSTGAWLVVELQKLGLRCAIYDPEYRARQWAARVAGLGGDLSQVDYLTPEDLGPKLAGKPMWDAAPAIGRMTRRADVRLIDGVMAAIGLGEERLKSDARAPFDYVRSLEALGGTAVSFGLTPKGQATGEPYGSMAWVAAHRFCWLGTRAEAKPDEHKVRWQPRKRNERGYVPSYLLSFTYGEDEQLVAAERKNDAESMRHRLIELMAGKGWHTTSGLAEELLADAEDVTTVRLDAERDLVRRTLNRMYHDGVTDKEGELSKVRWRLV